MEIEGLRVFEDRLKALHEVGIALSILPTVDELCLSAVELGRKKLGFDRLSIWLSNNQTQMMHGTYGTDESGQTRDERHDQFHMSEDPLWRALRDHSWMAFDADCDLANDHMEPIGRGWNAMAVLWDGDVCLGCIYADNLLNRRPATHYDLEILRLLASTVGNLCVRRQAEETLMQERLEAALQKEKVALLTEFISNLSHDLKNPLAVIKANLYLIERLNDPVREKAKLAVIKDQTGRLEKLIEDVLTMSRLENGAQFHFEPLDFNHLVSEIHEKIQGDCEKKNQVLTLDLVADLPPVRGVKEELRRAVFKLVENAIHYTPEAGSITLRTCLEDETVRLMVSDTGIGISDEDLPRIFERFYRTDPARSTATGGTGLGLAIVRKIAEMHGGTVEAESHVDHGSCFRLELPAAEY